MGRKIQAQAKDQSQRKKRALAVGALLSPLVEPALRSKGAVLAQILPHWRAICPMLAPYSLPDNVRGDVLTVAVESDAVKQELLYVAPQVVEGVNMLLGYEAIRKVRAVTRAQANSGGLKQKPAFAPVRDPVVVDDKLKTLCKSVRDDGLRAALERLGAHISAAKKKEEKP